MGLPIWRDPDEKKGTTGSTHKNDPTACARSSIRRRPSVYERRTPRPRLSRDFSARFDRSPPHASAIPHFRDLQQRREEGGSSSRVFTAQESAHRALPATSSTHISSNGPGHYPLISAGAVREDLRNAATRQPDDRPYFNDGTQDSFGSTTAFPASAWQLDGSSSFRLEGGFYRQPTLVSQSRHYRDQQRSRDLTDTLPIPLPAMSRSDENSNNAGRNSAIQSTTRRSHPLSNSWRPDSPVDGLGDRDRSPTPPDGWEVFRSTITPDETLPSFESSFTGAAASRSFSSSNTTGDSAASSSDRTRLSSSNDSQGDSVSSVDPADLICTDEEVREGRTLAFEMFRFESTYPEGRERINTQLVLHYREGNRFASSEEPCNIEIGYRLLGEALETEEGRERLNHVYNNLPQESRRFDNPSAFVQRLHSMLRRRLFNPHPERSTDEFSLETHDNAQRGYELWFRNVNTPHQRNPIPLPQSSSQDSASQPNLESSVAPTASTAITRSYDVNNNNNNNHDQDTNNLNNTHSRQSSERRRSQRRRSSSSSSSSGNSQAREPEVSDALLTGEFNDLDSMRRIVERLAARDDVPDEWWMSIGLNLSRVRPRRPTPDGPLVTGTVGSESLQSERLESGERPWQR